MLSWQSSGILNSRWSTTHTDQKESCSEYYMGPSRIRAGYLARCAVHMATLLHARNSSIDVHLVFVAEGPILTSERGFWERSYLHVNSSYALSRLFASASDEWTDPGIAGQLACFKYICSIDGSSICLPRGISNASH
jgi:hypothetical protein